LPETLNFFDAVLYINLDHREDRKNHLLQELYRLQVDPHKIHRMRAHLDPLNGHRGCALSHKEALDFAILKKFKKVLILEDDCVFSKKTKEVALAIKRLKNLKENWDAYLLGGDLASCEESAYSGTVRVRKALRAHAYAVQGKYLPFLRDCFEESYQNLKNCFYFFDALELAIDRRWQLLQREDRWYAPQKLVAFQGESFSDICYLDLMER
jgi:hypothetical protein